MKNILILKHKIRLEKMKVVILHSGYKSHIFEKNGFQLKIHTLYLGERQKKLPKMLIAFGGQHLHR